MHGCRLCRREFRVYYLAIKYGTQKNKPVWYCD